jgi:N-carbamoyl-L-amino-acid hydrolase
MFDGILGCLAGLEVLRTVHESGVKPYCSLAAIVWTNEYVFSLMPTLPLTSTHPLSSSNFPS